MSLPLIAPVLSFFGTKLGKYAAVGLGVLILVAVIWWQIDRYGDSRYQQGVDEVRAEIDAANRRYEAEKARADGLAAERRTVDAVAVNELERDLIDEIRQAPDGTPDAASLRLNCERLRRQHGSRSAELPAACRT